MSDEKIQLTLSVTLVQMIAIGQLLNSERYGTSGGTIPLESEDDAPAVTPSNSFAVDADPFETLRNQTQTESEKTIELEPDVELDSAGLPWDERIHASSKNKDKDGTWRFKQKVDREVLVPTVEAELRAAVEAMTENKLESLFPTQTPTVENPASQAFGAPQAPAPTAVTQAPTAVTQAPTAVTQAPTAVTQAPQMTFAEVLPLYTSAISQNLLNDETVKSVLSANFQLSSFGDLAAHPHLIGQAALALGLIAQK